MKLHKRQKSVADARKATFIAEAATPHILAIVNDKTGRSVSFSTINVDVTVKPNEHEITGIVMIARDAFEDHTLDDITIAGVEPSALADTSTGEFMVHRVAAIRGQGAPDLDELAKIADLVGTISSDQTPDGRLSNPTLLPGVLPGTVH